MQQGTRGLFDQDALADVAREMVFLRQLALANKLAQGRFVARRVR